MAIGLGWKPPQWMLACAAALGLAAVLDATLGVVPLPHVALAGLAGLRVGRRAGLGMAGAGAALAVLAAAWRMGPGFERQLSVWLNAALVFGMGALAVRAAERRREAEETIERLTKADPLTETMLYSLFCDLAQKEVARLSRHKRPLAVLFIDIDGFAAVNEQYGRKAGDELLRLTARSILLSVRAVDLVARVGPDEFVVMLPETPHAGALEVMERMRQRLGGLLANSWKATVSIGGVSIEQPPVMLDALMASAEARLLRVKESGGNGALLDALALDGVSA